jgi:predicted transcriptional regulator
MDSSEAARIVALDTTVANKIRALDAAGYPRAEIARLLNKRPQHVRNVLEDDKLYGRRPRTPLPATEPVAGVAETSPTFAPAQRLTVEAGGLVRLPPEVLDALQAKPGSVIIAELEADGLKLFTNRAAWDRVRQLVRQFGIDPKRDLVAELIAERRAEVERDD